MFTNGELVELGFVPFTKGDKADAAVLQADHHEYSTWGPDDVRGVRTLLNGRRVNLPKFERACVIVGVDD